MRSFPVPFNEEARLRSVFSVPGLTQSNNAVFDAICEAARKLLGCPVAHVSVLEDDSQWYKSVVGIELGRMPRENSFCAHTIMSAEPLVVTDLSADPRFKTHPMVVEGGPQVRFYAGVPLILSSGQRFGSLCALDLAPHDAPPGETEMAILADLGQAVVAALEATPPEATVPCVDREAKASFITLVGHELRTPMTVLLGSLGLLGVSNDNDSGSRMVNSALKSARHLRGLLESIIDYSDAATGELRLNERSCALQEILDDVADLSLPGADGTLKSPSVNPGAAPIEILADPDQLRTALNALALNAINHGGDEIVIDAALDAQGNLEITVTDDGSLDENIELTRLYEPFVLGGALENRDTRGGLGLGLPLTRKLVELHGGEFEVQAAPGSTTAVIRLPAWRLEAAERVA
ncbi:sensor histidine kinase [Salipiger sp. IMCC34102]|uniref:GAF domain-containing sensor histidine kinase n=1 Tax=Salipiger sp. IMCC34102 TaxID=2510647 RepID=UPI00101C408A|nr:GAF domain-containing sensor histidine kinase [Salipiger sp. IMCC34102]RYH01867.1 sensor histidine kinase [Salipiger sp. IMCC34102]